MMFDVLRKVFNEILRSGNFSKMCWRSFVYWRMPFSCFLFEWLHSLSLSLSFDSPVKWHFAALFDFVYSFFGSSAGCWLLLMIIGSCCIMWFLWFFLSSQSLCCLIHPNSRSSTSTPLNKFFLSCLSFHFKCFVTWYGGIMHHMYTIVGISRSM